MNLPKTTHTSIYTRRNRVWEFFTTYIRWGFYFIDICISVVNIIKEATTVEEMELVVDMREHGIIEKLKGKVSFKIENLILGDMVIRDSTGLERVLFERKTYSDLLASIHDGRYQEQSMRLLNTGNIHSHNIVYVIEKDSTTGTDRLQKIRSAIVSLHYFKGFSVMRTASISETVEFLISYLDKVTREDKSGKKVPAFTTRVENPQSSSAANYCGVVQRVKRDNITPNNISEIVLCQIPGVGESVATVIGAAFPTFSDMIDALREKRMEALKNLRTIDKNGAPRRISGTVMKNILVFLTNVQAEDEQVFPPQKEPKLKQKRKLAVPKEKKERTRTVRPKINTDVCLL